MLAVSGCAPSLIFARASDIPTTRGTSTSFTLQFAVRLGPRPTKYDTSSVSRQLPLSSLSTPSRHVTRFDVAYWYEYGGKESGTVSASASFVNVRQISAGEVPPSAGRPWELQKNRFQRV